MTTSSRTERLPLFERVVRASSGRTESAGAPVSGPDVLESVREALSALFNATALDAVVDLADYPHAKSSVVNYGLPDLSGRTASSVEPAVLERQLRRAICSFEPRLQPESVMVRVVADAPVGHNRLSFEITAQSSGVPSEERVAFRTELDLESGDFRVTRSREASRRGGANLQAQPL
jgi:type VI secretion system protein ImpF